MPGDECVLTFLFVLGATGLLAACSPNQPDCGSSQTAELVNSFAIENKIDAPYLAKALDDFRIADGETLTRADIYKIDLDELQPEENRCESLYYNGPSLEVHFYCTEGGPRNGKPDTSKPYYTYYVEKVKPIAERINALSKKLDSIQSDEAKMLDVMYQHNIAFKLSNIIMDDRNDKTGSVLCHANLAMIHTTPTKQDVIHQSDLKFRVDKTTDGKLAITMDAD